MISITSSDQDTLRILTSHLARTLEGIALIEGHDGGPAWTRAERLRRKYAMAVTTLGGIEAIVSQLRDGVETSLATMEGPPLCETCGFNPHEGPCMVPYISGEHRLASAQGAFCANYFTKTCVCLGIDDGHPRYDVTEHMFLPGKRAHVCGECAEMLEGTSA